jgi:hypothetical protein
MTSAARKSRTKFEFMRSTYAPKNLSFKRSFSESAWRIPAENARLPAYVGFGLPQFPSSRQRISRPSQRLWLIVSE